MTRHASTDKRELVLFTALKLFSERGYFNTSVHDIQKQAKVSIGSIYHHFGNKESIAKALFTHIESTMHDEIAAINIKHPTCHARCKAIIAYLFEETEKNPDAMQYMLYAKHREFMPEEKPVCSSRPFTLMKEMVEEGIRTGEVRQMDINVTAASIFGGAIRLIFLRLDGVLDQPLPYYLEECWACAWRGVHK